MTTAEYRTGPRMQVLRNRWKRSWSLERRPWLVGQAPAKGYGRGTENEDYTPCGGAFGRRLSRLVGGETEFDTVVFLSCFNRTNVLHFFPGSGEGKGDCFPMEEARARGADLLANEIPPSEPIIACGKQTARSFGVRDPEYLTWERLGGAAPHWVAPFPHPSGINRWWNDDTNRAMAREFLRGVLVGREVPDGLAG